MQSRPERARSLIVKEPDRRARKEFREITPLRFLGEPQGSDFLSLIPARCLRTVLELLAG